MKYLFRISKARMVCHTATALKTGEEVFGTGWRMRDLPIVVAPHHQGVSFSLPTDFRSHQMVAIPL